MSNSNTTPLPRDARAAIVAMMHELRGELCACGKKKRKGKTFCYSCYMRLPQEMRGNLYLRVGAGYEFAYGSAREFLARPAVPRP